MNTEDDEGNSPLHVKCFGETNKPTETGCLELLIQNRARLLARNQRVGNGFVVIIRSQAGVSLRVWVVALSKQPCCFFSIRPCNGGNWKNQQWCTANLERIETLRFAMSSYALHSVDLKSKKSFLACMILWRSN